MTYLERHINLREALVLPQSGKERAPLMGTELIDNLMALGNREFGRNLASMLIEENYDGIVTFGEPCIGKTSVMNQLTRQLMMGARKQSTRVENIFMDHVIKWTIENRKNTPQNPAEWGEKDPEAWKFVSDRMFNTIIEPFKKKVLSPTQHKKRVIKRIELTGLGYKENEDKGQSTLKRLAEYLNSPPKKGEEKLKLLVVGMAYDKRIKQEGKILRDLVLTLPDDKVIDFFRRERRTIWGGFSQELSQSEAGALIKKEYMLKGRESRVDDYEEEMLQDLLDNRHTYIDYSNQIPPQALNNSDSAAELVHKVNQMGNLLYKVYGFSQKQGILAINTFNPNMKTEYISLKKAKHIPHIT